MFRRATGIITAACCRSHARCLPSTFSPDRFVRHGYPANGNSYVAPDSPKPVAGVGFSHSIRGYCITWEAYIERIASANQMEVLHKEIKDAINVICLDFIRAFIREKIRGLLASEKVLPEPAKIDIYLSNIWEDTILLAEVYPTVYVMLGPDKKLYVGETDADKRPLCDVIRSYRSNKEMHDALFFYILVPRRSMGRQIKSCLIDQLPNRGFHASNIDSKRKNKRKNVGTSNIHE